jgi:hypothetical protein
MTNQWRIRQLNGTFFDLFIILIYYLNINQYVFLDFKNTTVYSLLFYIYINFILYVYVRIHAIFEVGSYSAFGCSRLGFFEIVLVRGSVF